jgi:hypothetical protein
MTDEEHRGVVSSLTALGEKAIGSVPPALLILVLINIAFLFIDWQQNASRERVLAQIITSCLQKP